MTIRPKSIRLRTSCWLAAFAILIPALALGTPAAMAVEPAALSITAEATTAVRAIFHMHPDANVRNDDHMAMAMVHPAYWHYSSLTDDFEGAYEIMKTFQWTSPFYINARTKHIDNILQQAAADGIGQVVNLGAGYDTRAYRYRKAMPNVKFYEIDLPEMVAEKKRRLDKVLRYTPRYVGFVPVDFNKQSIPNELRKAGYDPGVKTLFIWEGVTMYISGQAVDSTLKFIATQSAPESSVVYDYMPLAIIQGDFTEHADMRGLAFWVRYRGEPFTFGIPEGEGAAYVEARGLEVLSDIGAEDMGARYLTRSDGTLDGKCATGFRIVHAAVPAR